MSEKILTATNLGEQVTFGDPTLAHCGMCSKERVCLRLILNLRDGCPGFLCWACVLEEMKKIPTGSRYSRVPSERKIGGQ